MGTTVVLECGAELLNFGHQSFDHFRVLFEAVEFLRGIAAQIIEFAGMSRSGLVGASEEFPARVADAAVIRKRAGTGAGEVVEVLPRAGRDLSAQ